MFKFIHAADVHLDSPLRGLERYEGAPADRIRIATRDAFDNLIQLALAERVDFILLAGDLYDSDQRDFNTGLYLMSRLQTLARANIRAFIITGNHDGSASITSELTPPDNTHIFSSTAAESVTLDNLSVAVHGRSYHRRHIQEDLTRTYPPPSPGHFNIGLLHTSGDGAADHDVYAPCSISGLATKGYDYWALGHVHHHAVLHESPLIIYPGNTQGRHIRETGPKGCIVITVDGHLPHWRFEPLDVLRWHLCEIDASEDRDATAVTQRATDALADAAESADGRLLAIRLVIQGTTAAHAELLARPQHWTREIRARAMGLGAGDLWIEQVRFGTTPISRAPAADVMPGPLQDIFAAAHRLHHDPSAFASLLQSEEPALTQLREELESLARRLPRHLLEGDHALRLDAADTLHAHLRAVAPLLHDHLRRRQERA